MGGEPYWKGFIIIAIASLGCFAAMTLAGSTNAVISFILSVVIAGVVGGIMKMTGRQISSVLIGAVVVLVPVLVVMDFVK